MKKCLMLMCSLCLLLALWSCSSNCERNTDCPSGNYCGTDKTCQRECRLNSDCEGGKSCSATGQCVAGDDGSDGSVEKENVSEAPKEEAKETSPEVTSCKSGEKVSCYEGATGTNNQGACRSGEKACVRGVWSACLGQVLPSKEVCDGKDNDCNGQTDENLSKECGESTVGACKKGTQTCQQGQWSSCQGEVKPSKEVCDDQVDNNCDGKIDEDCPGTCKITVTSSKLDFGSVYNESSKTIEVGLTNKGKSPCKIKSVKIEDSAPSTSHGRFQILDSQKLPITLASGASLKLEVRFAPFVRSTYKSTLKIDAPDNKEGQKSISLEGKSMENCLLFSYSQIDFGSVKSTCSSRTKKVDIYNARAPGCPSSIMLTAASLEAGQASSFQLKPSAVFPANADSNVVLELSFHPPTTGIQQETLVIKHDIKGYPDIRIPLIGEGVTNEKQKDVFTQTIAKPDILFIVDDSAGMTSKQQILSKNFPAFMAAALQSNADYQLATTTTSTSGRRFPAGCFVGKEKLIKPTTKNPAKVFETNVLGVGSTGDGYERGFDAAYQALSGARLNDPKCNQGFLRKGASLSLIFVSDEYDQSRQAVSFYISFFRSLKSKYQLKSVVASSIAGPANSSKEKCSIRTTPRYMEIAKQLGGVQGDICKADWSSFLGDISKKTLSIPDTFVLSRAADETSIVVKTNNQVVAKSDSDGWKYDAKNNSIIFSGSKVPAAGDSLSIEYKTVCKP